ncbi:hypothetical protein EV182_001438 [Spiromyces aspiralis]|uniref:Uncharacterized protein n=1 Tax=Spiromyces aspiralis TaxID=68401 RepID=A0ACC1HFW6_9FUNG|nr:hypothetical protein EV182_001438 [Spiromyces aspiralis]
MNTLCRSVRRQFLATASRFQCLPTQIQQYATEATAAQVQSSPGLLIRSKPAKQLTKFNKPFSPRKQYLFLEYEKIFSETPAVLVVQCNNLKSTEWTELRQKLLKEGQGARATLTRTGIVRAVVKNTELTNIRPLFSGPTCVIHWTAKDIAEHGGKLDLSAGLVGAINCVEKHKKLVLVGGKVAGQLMNPEMVKRVAELPPLDQLRGQVVGLLQMPARRLHDVLSRNQQRLLGLLKQHSEGAGSPPS